MSGTPRNNSGGPTAGNSKEPTEKKPSEELVENGEANSPKPFVVDKEHEFWTEGNDMSFYLVDSDRDAEFETDLETDKEDWFDPEAFDAAHTQKITAAKRLRQEAKAKKEKESKSAERTSSSGLDTGAGDSTLDGAFRRAKIEDSDDGVTNGGQASQENDNREAETEVDPDQLFNNSGWESADTW